MIKKNHGAMAALLAVTLAAGALFSSCGSGDSIPVSSAKGSAGPTNSNGQNTSGGALQSNPDDKRQNEKSEAKTLDIENTTDINDPGSSGSLGHFGRSENSNIPKSDSSGSSDIPKSGSSRSSDAPSGSSDIPKSDSSGSSDSPKSGSSRSSDIPKSGRPGSSDGSVPSEDLDDSYFDDAVFIGDSLTEGFQLHGGLTNAAYYGFKNLNIKAVFEKSLVKSENGKITIAAALQKNDFGKYYIMLGANELGWVYPKVFTKKYGELIDLILEENPEAKIYLQSVLPVSEEISRTSNFYSNDRINYYDELISALADEKGVTYLNVRDAVQNEQGVLPDDAATDGVHLNKDYCRKWADYLREHK